MSPLNRSSTALSPLARKVAIVALIGAGFLAGPLTAARADPASNPPAASAENGPEKSQAGKDATRSRGETVEQRITNLHAALKITPEEEPKWSSVAQAMRENAANMDKLVAAKRTQAPQDMTALESLTTYQEFAQAHVDGLKNLTSSFKALYDSMPDAQKKTADEVFRDFGHKRPKSHH